MKSLNPSSFSSSSSGDPYYYDSFVTERYPTVSSCKCIKLGTSAGPYSAATNCHTNNSTHRSSTQQRDPLLSACADDGGPGGAWQHEVLTAAHHSEHHQMYGQHANPVVRGVGGGSGGLSPPPKPPKSEATMPSPFGELVEGGGGVKGRDFIRIINKPLYNTTVIVISTHHPGQSRQNKNMGDGFILEICHDLNMKLLYLHELLRDQRDQSRRRNRHNTNKCTSDVMCPPCSALLTCPSGTGITSGFVFTGEVEIENQSVSDIGIVSLMNVFLTFNVQLVRLRAYRNKISDRGCLSVARVIQDTNTHVREIHLSHNQISTHAFKQLVNALPKSRYILSKKEHHTKTQADHHPTSPHQLPSDALSTSSTVSSPTAPRSLPPSTSFPSPDSTPQSLNYTISTPATPLSPVVTNTTSTPATPLSPVVAKQTTECTPLTSFPSYCSDRVAKIMRARPTFMRLEYNLLDNVNDMLQEYGRLGIMLCTSGETEPSSSRCNKSMCHSYQQRIKDGQSCDTLVACMPILSVQL
eukprot:GHVQ01002818.1.p1 GENE.GHVQ01002818.1~~GHVQ01002818.1.p1  ORF type:complete len:525 (+),score=72.40 GHVQ01002818.1:49-1623(+)